MKSSSRLIATLFVILSTFLYSCAQPPVASTPTVLPTSTVVAKASKSADTSATRPPKATPIPTITNTAEPEPLPGVQVHPVSSLADSIPWLPFNEADRPMAVYYGFNLNKPPFNNVLVRQAFAAAVDREKIAEKSLEYYFRNAAPATTLTPPEILSRDLYNEIGIRFDPARARQLLQEAGYSSVESFPQTTLLVSTRGKAAPGAYFQMAKMIVEMWQTNLGIAVDIEIAEVTGYPARFATDPPEIYQLGWVADYNDPDNFLNALFHSNNDVNYGRFSNEEFDQLVEQAAQLTDPEERLLLYIQAERILTEQDTAIIPLYHSYMPNPYVF